MKRGVVLLICMALTLAGWPAEGGDAPVVERDIVFGKGGEVELKLDLVRPAGPGPYPAVICVHGGGWRGGKRQDVEGVLQTLARKQFVAISCSYRLTQVAPFPAQIEDCKAAVRWARANAGKYGIDPQRLGALGFSAGAHLACLLGCADHEAGLEGNGGNTGQSSRVRAVVSFFGPSDFMVKTWNKQVEDYFLVPLFGGPFEEKQAEYERGSPLRYVSKDDPPHLFFHGGKDTLVGMVNSEKMVARLRAVGVPAELIALPEEGHGWGGAALAKTIEQTVHFFEERLRK
jgi:acetyl esterase/lipase